MPDTLLTIVQTVCDELGLQRPSVVVNSTDFQTRQLYALINRELREIQQNYDWTALQTEFDLTVSPPVSVVGNLVQGSATVSGIVGSLAGVAPNYWIAAGQGLTVNSRVIGVASSPSDFSNDVNPDFAQTTTTLTLSEPASATVSGAPLVLSQDTYAGPIDFSRFINETWWDRTNRWALFGPTSPQKDQWHRSGIVTVGPRRHFRQIGYSVPGDFGSDLSSDFSSGGIKNYRLWPPPGTLDTPINIAFEYISSNPVYSTGGQAQPNFQADTDFPILDSQILVLGAKWRFFQIKGFDYSDLKQEYQDYVDRAYANDGGAKTLSLTRGRGSNLLSGAVTQDGYFPGPVGPNMS